MDSSNYLHSHYHHLHDQKHPANGSPSPSSSSPSSSPSIDNPSSSTSSSCFGVVLHDSHQWTPNTTLINSNYKLTTPPNSEAILKPSTSSPHENFNPMSQNPSGFQWPELGDIPTNTFPKFTDMLINGTTSTNILDDDLQLCPSSYMKSNSDLSAELSQKLMLKTLLSSTSRSMEDDEFHFTGTGGGARGFVFSQIHPSVNISSPTSNYQSSSSSSWPTFDLLSSARFSDDHKRFSGNSLWSERESSNCGLYDHGKEELYRSSCSSSLDHVSRSYGDHNKTMDAKRPSSSVEAKAPVGSKKTRVESRPSSCPPMKVRKEKLGDRIAALQQLVAPFGKTDTASVLMEAIGYIKFLQNQIQTLSVPYMKSQRNDNNRTSQQRGNGEATKPDLKSRGLCLVPLTCMSYVTNDGTGVWPPPNFRGGI